MCPVLVWGLCASRTISIMSWLALDLPPTAKSHPRLIFSEIMSTSYISETLSHSSVVLASEKTILGDSRLAVVGSI